MQTNPDLTEFVQAIEDNDLVDLVDGPEPVTVLAPTNDFVEPGQLTADQVRLQLIPELLSEFQLFQRTTVPTLLTDQELVVDASTDPPIVGGVTILDHDVPASNGFIQTVNGVTVGQPVP
jgi:hypothetical protein